jgi:hypothetical protein
MKTIWILLPERPRMLSGYDFDNSNPEIPKDTDRSGKEILHAPFLPLVVLEPLAFHRRRPGCSQSVKRTLPDTCETVN